MKEESLKNKLLLQSTLGDLVETLKESGLIGERSKERGVGSTLSSKKEYVYGIAGLAKLFGCSKATAQRIKSNGTIDAAISQNGKIIVVDGELALDLLKVSNNKWGNKKSK